MAQTVEESACSVGNLGSIPGLGRPGGGPGKLQVMGSQRDMTEGLSLSCCIGDKSLLSGHLEKKFFFPPLQTPIGGTSLVSSG